MDPGEAQRDQGDSVEVAEHDAQLPLGHRFHIELPVPVVPYEIPPGFTHLCIAPPEYLQALSATPLSQVVFAPEPLGVRVP